MSPLDWKTFKIIWLPHFAQEETEKQFEYVHRCVNVGGGDLPENAQGTRNLLVLGEGGEGGNRGPWRPEGFTTVTVQPGGWGREVWESWGRRFRSQGTRSFL